MHAPFSYQEKHKTFSLGKVLRNSPAGPDRALVSGRGGHLPGLERGAGKGDGESGCPGSPLHPSVGDDKATASPSRAGAGSPAER